MRDNGRLATMMIRSGLAAALVAGLLVIWIAATSVGTPEDAVETAALTPTTAPPLQERSVQTPSETEEPSDSEAADEDRPSLADLIAESAITIPSNETAGSIADADAADTGATTDDGSGTTASAGGSAPVRIPAAACGAVGSPVSSTGPFTGRPATAPAGFPAVVIKVSNNSSASRAALIGLDEADIVFEERIEANATRFAAVFHSSLPNNVGPIRSGRTTDIEVVANLGQPVFGYSGSNPGVAGQLRHAADLGLLVPVINTDRAPFARDSRYRAPDNLFVDPTALGGCGDGGTPTSIFGYGAIPPASATAASSVSFDARSPYRFDWDGNRWIRSQSGTVHTTRSGAPLAADNVVVLFVDYVTSAIDSSSVDAKTVGSGQMWLFRNGTITTGRWDRSRPRAPYALTDDAGASVTLQPGQTWVVLAGPGTATRQ